LNDWQRDQGRKAVEIYLNMFLQSIEERTEDALHIAIAAVEKIDFIATWNFKHINNPFTKNKIKQIIEDARFSCPILASPEELLGKDS
jgi:hypothetical protein